MGDALIRNQESMNGAEDGRTSAPPRDVWHTSGTSPSNNAGFQYEELMGGSIPCPSCMGSGRIPKERESELVALIPVNDKRLRPRRTGLWLTIGIGVTLFVCGLLLFFLIPRSLDVNSKALPVAEVTMVTHVKKEKIVLNFLGSVYISNGNFYPVRAVNATANLLNKWNVPSPSVVIGHGVNKTGLSVPLRQDNVQLVLNYTAEITDKWMVMFCESEFGYWVQLQFDVTVTFEYMGHREQDTTSATHSVCCRTETGNCTLDETPPMEFASPFSLK